MLVASHPIRSLLAVMVLLGATHCTKTERDAPARPPDAGRTPQRQAATNTVSTGIEGVALGIDRAALRTTLPRGEHLVEQETRLIAPRGKGVGLLDILKRTCHCFLPGRSFHLHVPVFGEPAACDFHFAVEQRLSAVTCGLDAQGGVDAYLALVRGLVARLTKAYGAPAEVPTDPEKTECAFGERCDKVWIWKTERLRVELSSMYDRARHDVKLAVMTPAHARLEHQLARLADRQCRTADAHEPDTICVGVPAITPHEIAMVVRAHRHEVQDCYRDALARAPGLAGRVVAHVELTDDGARTTIADADTGDKAFEACVLNALERMRFPPLRYRIGQTVRVRYPFVFHPERPGGARPPPTVAYRSGEAYGATQSEGKVTITLPEAARVGLARAFPGHRLPGTRDFAAGAPGPPFPFAVVSDLDKRPGNDLALVLVSRDEPGNWRLVVLHGGGHPPVAVADASEVLPFFRARPGRRPVFFLTEEGRCFCGRRCVSLASDLGRSFEFSWNGTGYTGRIEDYLPE